MEDKNFVIIPMTQLFVATGNTKISFSTPQKHGGGGELSLEIQNELPK